MQWIETATRLLIDSLTSAASERRTVDAGQRRYAFGPGYLRCDRAVFAGPVRRLAREHPAGLDDVLRLLGDSLQLTAGRGHQGMGFGIPN
jgi:hypothetical protein